MRRTTRAARRATVAAGLTCGGAAIAALLAACGSNPSPAASSSSSTGTPTSAATTSAPATTAPASSAPAAVQTQCATSALTASVATTEGGAAAGSDYVPVDFTNISASSCVMYGFPGVSWVTGMRGAQIGLAAARYPGYPPVTVTVAPGGHAHAWLQVADAGNFSPSTCHPVTARWLRIIPPDQYTSLYASFTAQVCSGKNLGDSKPLSVTPVRAGEATRGHVP